VSRRVATVLTGVLLAFALLFTHAWRQSNGIRALTADVRSTYNLPAQDALFPIASLAEVIPDGLSPQEVVRKLQPLRERVLSEHWVAGKSVDKAPFRAHVIGLRLAHGGVYRVAFVYREGRLVDIDTPEYLGRTSELPADPGQAWVSAGAT
jgi:hypothetical protein